MQRLLPRFRLQQFFLNKICGQRSFLPKFRGLYADAMLVRIRHQHGGRKQTETSVTEFYYKSANLSLEKLKNIKIIVFLVHELFR